MNKDLINKLMSILPEGEKKQALRKKLNALNANSKKRGGDGLQDTFELQPKGHIKIEAIDESGNVVGVLADQANLVVDGAEEILLRSFSGDSNRVLYKNRIPKDVSGKTGKIYIAKSKLNNETNLINGSQLLHAPNLLWAEVDDKEFVVSYGYYPITVFVKEEISTEPGKLAFSVSNVAAVDRIPMSSEIHSTYTNLFIGIGEGKNESIELTDSRITASADVSVVAHRAVAKTVGKSLSFTEKISNFKLDLEFSNKGAQVDVMVNGALKQSIDTFDSELASPVVQSFEFNDFDYEIPTEVKIVFSAADVSIVEPTMTIVGVHFDALAKKSNKLIKEFKNFETDFLTPAAFNTTPMGPYTVQLPNFPLKPNSVVMNYNGLNFTEVTNELALADTTFMVDNFRGVVRFNRALSGLLGTYSSTGELYDVELTSSMTVGNVSAKTGATEVKTETNIAPVGVVNGFNKEFKLNHVIVPETLSVKVGGIASVDYTYTAATKAIVFGVAPALPVTVTYQHNVDVVVNRASSNYRTAFKAIPESVKIMDQDGVALTYAADSVDFKPGSFMVDEIDNTLVKVFPTKVNGTPISQIEIRYLSNDRPGTPTNYTRAVIEKPKTTNEYPWFELDKGAVRFVAEFPELKPAHNITIREMGLFDGPRPEDKILGFRNYPVKAFSLVRVGEARKEVNTGIRITWTITLLNSDGQPFQGGQN